jgi:hypothetical protein
MTTGAGSRTGRLDNVVGMARLVQKRPDLVMVFKPDKIEAGLEVGSEAGTWLEQWKEPDGPIELLGTTYLIMWVKQGDEWRQKVLLLVPTA